MRSDKQAAIRLRLTGRSYSEIRNSLGGIPKSTLSSWLKNVVLSDAARGVLTSRTRERSLAGLLKRNKRQTILAVRRKFDIQTEAKNQIVNISKEELLLIGASLYWAEGYKRAKRKNGVEVTNHPVSLTNADPQLLKMFIKFLVEICGVDRGKIKVGVRIFQHLNEESVLKYWSETLQIPRGNFTKTYLGISKSSMGKKPFNRLPYGIVQIRINNTNLFHRIMGWIEGIKGKV